jgi:methylenetetrahydrofolate--tRNA-(uracil-5-)-methyltransferase
MNDMKANPIIVIGGGLAGSEAALQIAERGLTVELYEMRPQLRTPAHQTQDLAELVCSNSLKSDRTNSAPWLLKEEMRRLGCRSLEIARRCSVPAGQALAVDRELFSREVTRRVESNPLISLRREEVRVIPQDRTVIIASGPLTSDTLADSIQKITTSDRLFFYDAISPIVDASTINCSVAFSASRYGVSLPQGPTCGNAGDQHTETEATSDGDYLNCPMSREEYQHFYEALVAAESVTRHEFEEAQYFEACLPIEELARRGRDTLRFGPMKPVGLTDPRSGKRPYAVVQLRKENQRADSFNLVGFQNHLKFGEQKRILRMIPGLEQAEFLRYGQIHRNTYINAPSLLNRCLQLRDHPHLFFAGQICGVEGYVESMATGMLAGIFAARYLEDQTIAPLPRATALGSLCHYLTDADHKNYQPANIAFDLLPPICSTAFAERNGKPSREDRRQHQCEIALRMLEEWKADVTAYSLVRSERPPGRS